MSEPERQKLIDPAEVKKEAVAQFTQIFGDVPFHEPNVQTNEDLRRYINGEDPSTFSCFWATLCGLTGIGCCYLWCKTSLVEDGKLAFMLDNGQPRFARPGWHMLASPTQEWSRTFSAGDDLIQISPITVVRVREGSVGFAFSDGHPEVLLPGRHARKNAAFKFDHFGDLSTDFLEFGPIKMLTVRSGCVRVCYDKGKVQILSEGRYAINSPTFVVTAEPIITRQQNLRFNRHQVMLDGGIRLLVEGLLTFKVENVEKLIHELGDNQLKRALENVTEAELSRVFSTIHLEQLVSSTKSEHNDVKHKPEDKEPEAFLGKEKPILKEGEEDDIRGLICKNVVDAVRPLVAVWGVRIITFQLNSTKLADERYAQEYESSSLEIAKAKASQRATVINRQTQLQQAKTDAEALRIEAEGKKVSQLIDAQALGESRRIDADSRNEAARSMNDPFAKKYALAGLQVEFAKSIKASHLTVLPSSVVGQIMGAQGNMG